MKGWGEGTKGPMKLNSGNEREENLGGSARVSKENWEKRTRYTELKKKKTKQFCQREK